MPYLAGRESFVKMPRLFAVSRTHLSRTAADGNAREIRREEPTERMEQKQLRPRRALPVLNPVPPPPPFNPAEVPPRAKMIQFMVWAVTKKVLHAPISLHTFGALRRTV